MKDYPNEEALRKAHRIYLDAMRPFIIQCLKRIQGRTLEDLIRDVSNYERSDDIETLIDINNIPLLIRNHWYDIFSKEFNSDLNVQNTTWLIVEGRNFWAHPGKEDVDPESTRMHLSLVARVLGEIKNGDAKQAVESIRDQLFSDEVEEHPAEVEKPELEKHLKTMSDRLKNVEKENAAYQKRIETITEQLGAANVEKAEYEKDPKATPNQLATPKVVSTQLEEHRETTPATEFPYTGSQLRDFRKKAGLTQVAVAVELGMKHSSSAAIGDWEAERVKVPRKHYTKLKELYGL